MTITFYASSTEKQPDSVHSKPFVLNKMKQYVGNITFLLQGKPVWKDTGNYYLLNLSDETKSSITLKHNIADFDEIRILLGVDSTTQSSGAMGGDLDPTKGMYWSWQSGYIHTKIEGYIADGSKQIPLEFHLGGYRYPFSTLQTINIQCHNCSAATVNFDARPLLLMAEKRNIQKLMSPGENARLLSEAWLSGVKQIK